MTKKRKPFTLRLDPELIAALDVIAEKERRSRNDQINFVIEKFVENYNSCNKSINN